MIILRYFVLFAFVFALFSSAHASNLLLKWDAPTTRSDGSALSSSEISGYRIYSKSNNKYELISEVGNVTEYHLEKGVGCVRLSTIDSAGLTSVLSDELCFNAPSPPDNYRLEINLIWTTQSSSP